MVIVCNNDEILLTLYSFIIQKLNRGKEFCAGLIATGFAEKSQVKFSAKICRGLNNIIGKENLWQKICWSKPIEREADHKAEIILKISFGKDHNNFCICSGGGSKINAVVLQPGSSVKFVQKSCTFPPCFWLCAKYSARSVRVKHVLIVESKV